MYIYVKIFLYGIAGKHSITNKINKCPDCSRGIIHSSLIMLRTQWYH